MGKKDISYFWGESTLRIALGNRTERALKWWYFIECCLSSSLALLFFFQSFSLLIEWMQITCLVGSVLLALVSLYRYISRRFAREEIVVSPYTLTIIHVTPFYKKSRQYLFQFMGPMHYIGKDARTAHPLKGFHYDYLGIDSNDALLNSLIHSGNILFNYKNEAVRFGKGIYSWNAEEMVRMIQLYTGDRLKLSGEWKAIMEEPEWQYWEH